MKKVFKIVALTICAVVICYFLFKALGGAMMEKELIDSNGPITASDFSDETGYDVPEEARDLYYLSRVGGMQSNDFYAKMNVSSNKIKSVIDVIISSSYSADKPYELKPIDRENVPGTETPEWWKAADITDGYYYYALGGLEYSSLRF